MSIENWSCVLTRKCVILLIHFMCQLITRKCVFQAFSHWIMIRTETIDIPDNSVKHSHWTPFIVNMWTWHWKFSTMRRVVSTMTALSLPSENFSSDFKFDLNRHPHRSTEAPHDMQFYCVVIIFFLLLSFGVVHTKIVLLAPASRPTFSQLVSCTSFYWWECMIRFFLAFK